MTDKGLLHAIDFGTSNSSIIVSQPDGVMTSIPDPAVMAASQSIRTAVCVLRGGMIAVGQAAENAKGQRPAAYRSEFKRDFGDPTPTKLADRGMSPDDMAVEVLNFLREQAQKTIPGDPEQVVITVPASWEAGNLELMRSVARRAGYGNARIELLAEPIAALAYAFGERPESAEHLTTLVYDLGGGTFDCAVARGTADGYEVLGEPGGLDDVGGAAFDRLILGLIRDSAGEANQDVFSGPTDDPRILARRLTLKDTCEEIKWKLSASEHYDDLLLELPTPVPFSLERAGFEALIRPLLAETISECDRLLDKLGLKWTDVQRVVPVGGSSRIPLVGEMLADRCQRPVLSVSNPDIAIVYGAALAGRRDLAPRDIFVNGRAKSVHLRELTFGEVVRLAFATPPAGSNMVITVTYDRAAGPKPSGSLVEGKKIKVRDGTIFNVTATDKS
jgi:molecular chaperone DnaK (HSP70)